MTVLKKMFFIVVLSLCGPWVSNTYSISIVPKGWQQKLDPVRPQFHNMGVKIIYLSTYLKLNSVEMYVQNVLHSIEEDALKDGDNTKITEEAINTAILKIMGGIQVGPQDGFEKRMVKEALLSLFNKYGDKIITEKPKAYDEKFHDIVHINIGCAGAASGPALSVCIENTIEEIKSFATKHSISACKKLSSAHLLESDVEACYKDFLDTMRCYDKKPDQCLELLQRKIQKYAKNQCPDVFEKDATIINANNCIDGLCGRSDGIIRFVKHGLCQIKFAFA